MARQLCESYPELAAFPQFTPAETAILAGVSTEKQRQCRHQRTAQFLREREDDGKHHRYNWEEVVLWALFAEVSSYGFDLASAAYFAARFSGIAGMSPQNDPVAYDRSQLLHIDYRVASGGREIPLYILCFPQIGKPESFLVSMTHSGSIDFDGTDLFAGRFGFWVNFSEFQRRLMLRYESVRS